MPSQNPTPMCVMVMNGIVTLLQSIRTSAGYFTDAGVRVGTIPLDYTQDQDFPSIVVQEEKATIGNTKSNAFQEDATYAVVGTLKASVDNSIAAAMLLRDDITVALVRARKVNFTLPDGTVAPILYQVAGDRDINFQPDGLDIVQVVVRVSCTTNQFITPAAQ